MRSSFITHISETGDYEQLAKFLKGDPVCPKVNLSYFWTQTPGAVAQMEMGKLNCGGFGVPVKGHYFGVVLVLQAV